MNRVAVKLRLISAVFLGLTLSAASAQDAPSTPPAVPHSAGGGLGWRAGASGRMAETGMGGRGVAGTVTAVAADRYTVKTDAGEVYTVFFSANTRIIKQTIRRHGEGGEGAGNPPQMLKSTDIKVGDAIAALGEVDTNGKSVGATVVVQVDPERAKQMREMQANYGKTWLMGKVTAIQETKVTLLGSIDNVPHAFQVDENTAFRKRREPITLAEIQVGDAVRVEGVVKEGTFTATSVSVMGMPPGGTQTVPRIPPPPDATNLNNSRTG